jgi:cyclophilin family peptidyl-prolyl cis-trans isomerase
MKKCLIFSLFLALCSCQPNPTKKETNMSNPIVTMRTTLGNIQIELYAAKAPITVENFLRYVDEKHYDHTIFHRVIDGFMIQGGGMNSDMKEKSTHAPIRNEAENRLSNQVGTIAMARTSDVHSASSQFFINVADNTFLDHRSPTPSGYGYCVFGKVISGMDVVNKIKAAKTATKRGHENVPIQSIEILEITRN